MIYADVINQPTGKIEIFKDVLSFDEVQVHVELDWFKPVPGAVPPVSVTASGSVMIGGDSGFGASLMPKIFTIWVRVK